MSHVVLGGATDILRATWVDPKADLAELIPEKAREERAATRRSSYRATRLSFMAEHTYLVEARDPGWDGARIYFVADGLSGKSWWLDGTRESLKAYQDAHEPTLETERQALDLLWLITFFLRPDGSGDVFALFESVDDAVMPVELARDHAELASQINQDVGPASCERNASGWRCSAHMYFQNAIAEVDFVMERGRPLDMVSDTILHQDLPVSLSQRIR